MSETLSCTTRSINNFAQFGYHDACNYVRDACADQTDTIDFFSFYYCDLNQSLSLFVPFSLLLIFLIFYAVSSTAEDYLEPTVTKIAKKLRFSESLAGVTLVALANGAADVIAAFAAGGNIEQGVLVPLGGLLGAGIFTISIILAVCILFSRQKTIRAEKEALVRDCGFYLFGVLYVLGLGFYGEINLVGTIGFLVQYVVFIAVVLYQEAQYRKEENRRRRIREKQGPSFTVTYGIESVYRGGRGPKSLQHLVKEDHIKIPAAHTSLLEDEDLEFKLDEGDRETLLSSQKGSPSFLNLQWKYAMVRHKIWHEFQDLAGKNILGKVFYVLVYPLKIARDLTIPASDSESWEKWKALIQPFGLTLFLLWQFGFFDLLRNPVFLGVYLALCLICSVSVWKLTSNNEVPEGAAGVLLMILAFAASVTWINLVANILVDFIALLAVFTNLPLNFLGLTLVAFGGSTPDFFVDLTLARKGLGQTAASGIFAGQYFNVGVGFGVALTRQVLSYGARPFSLVPNSNTAIINLILIGSLIGGLVVVLAYGLKNQFVFKKGFAIYSLIFYAAFLASVSALSSF